MPSLRNLFRLLGGPGSDDFDRWIARQPQPPLRFENVVRVDVPPEHSAVLSDRFYVVARNRQPKWALFKCPCGCGAVVTLSLQAAHRPHWRLIERSRERPTLSPSIWRDVGCMSHFWVHDGRVYWCSDTGSPPWRWAHD